MDELTEDEIYKLAEKVKDWNIFDIDRGKYEGNIGHLCVSLYHDFNTLSHKSIRVYIDIRTRGGLSSSSIGIVSTADQRFLALYERVAKDCKDKIASERDRLTREGLKEARTLLGKI